MRYRLDKLSGTTCWPCQVAPGQQTGLSGGSGVNTVRQTRHQTSGHRHWVWPSGGCQVNQQTRRFQARTRQTGPDRLTGPGRVPGQATPNRQTGCQAGHRSVNRTASDKQAVKQTNKYRWRAQGQVSQARLPDKQTTFGFWPCQASGSGPQGQARVRATGSGHHLNWVWLWTSGFCPLLQPDQPLGYHHFQTSDHCQPGPLSLQGQVEQTGSNKLVNLLT